MDELWQAAQVCRVANVMRPYSEPPTALATAFTGNPDKARQWQAFLCKSKLGAEKVGLEEVASALRGFLLPPAQALVRGESFPMHWSAAGPWTTLPASAETPSPGSGT